TRICYTDPRRFGRIRLVRQPLENPPVSELGFDPIINMPTLADFTRRVQPPTQRHRGGTCIKALLLDQRFAAGVGNWIADEILYQSGVHPARPTRSLTTAELTRLHQWTARVCQVAVDCNADKDRFPADWLFHVRWGKARKTVQHVTRKGEPVVFETVGGRTSAIVPTVQMLPPLALPPSS
ncbi:hypothetical protein BJ085DRAFT_9292, partial [Dimargaris cristalligena]